jgi:hypothetical protein
MVGNGLWGFLGLAGWGGPRLIGATRLSASPSCPPFPCPIDPNHLFQHTLLAIEAHPSSLGPRPRETTHPNPPPFQKASEG